IPRAQDYRHHEDWPGRDAQGFDHLLGTADGVLWPGEDGVDADAQGTGPGGVVRLQRIGLSDRRHGQEESLSGCMSEPLHVAFLGCGFITRVHSRHLKTSLSRTIVPSYASRDRGKAEEFRRQFGGRTAFGSYDAAIADRSVDAVVIAVPPRFHLDLSQQALAAGKHVLVEKPAFLHADDYLSVIAQRDRAGRTVLVGENDHYKPLAVCLRRLLAEDAIGEMVFGHFVTVALRLKTADDWRNDESMAGGDAFFEEGIHWLHVAGSLGPRIARVTGFRPPAAHDGPDRRAKSMMVAFQYDNGAAGTLFYSREVPSLLRGLRLSKIYGRRGVITFESN